jgi:ribosomal protein L2
LLERRECTPDITVIYHKYKPGVRAGYALPTKISAVIVKAHKAKVSIRLESGEVTSVHPEHLEMMK